MPVPKGIKVYIKPNEKEVIEGFWFEEILRYAGVLKVDKAYDGRTYVKIWLPKALDARTWSQHQIERLASFGYIAETF